MFHTFLSLQFSQQLLPLRVFTMQCSGVRRGCWLSIKSLPLLQCQSNSSADTGEERRGEAAAETLLFRFNVEQESENNWVTCTVIRHWLLMFHFYEWDPPSHAANGSGPWRWMSLHQSQVKPVVASWELEGAPLWGWGSSLLRQQCSAWYHQMCVHWGWVELWFSVGREKHQRRKSQ